MDGLRNSVARALRGPVGGLVAMLVLALVLGGVAMANPGGSPNDHATHGQTPSEEPTAPSDGQDQETGDTGDPAAATHTAANCTDLTKGVQADLPAQDEATGLANAIYVVGANCEKNLQAPGLLVALQHLVTNFQRHQDHDASVAAKAEARANGTHGNSGSSHGHAGEHGPPSSSTGS